MYQLGIDVSKKTLDICLMREGIRGRLKTKRIKNDFKAVHIITAWLEHHNWGPLGKRNLWSLPFLQHRF